MAPSRTDYERRIRTLEAQLLERPQTGDVEHAQERLLRKKRMCDAAIRRNEILKRRLEEAQARIRDLEKVPF